MLKCKTARGWQQFPWWCMILKICCQHHHHYYHYNYCYNHHYYYYCYCREAMVAMAMINTTTISNRSASHNITPCDDNSPIHNCFFQSKVVVSYLLLCSWDKPTHSGHHQPLHAAGYFEEEISAYVDHSLTCGDDDVLSIYYPTYDSYTEWIIVWELDSRPIFTTLKTIHQSSSLHIVNQTRRFSSHGHKPQNWQGISLPVYQDIYTYHTFSDTGRHSHFEMLPKQWLFNLRFAIPNCQKNCMHAKRTSYYDSCLFKKTRR